MTDLTPLPITTHSVPDWIRRAANKINRLNDNMSSVERALRANRSYLAGTGIVDVQAGDSLYITITNPENSGRNIYLYDRWFDNNVASGGSPLQYTAFSQPTLLLSNSANNVNLTVGELPSDSAIVRFQTGSGLDLGGIQGSTSPLPTGGNVLRVSVLSKLKPNTSIGFKIDGGGNNLVQATRIGMTMLWYEELI